MSGPITCARCGANNPPGASWCSLCHTPFTPPAAPPPPEPAGSAESGRAVPAQRGDPGDAFSSNGSGSTPASAPPEGADPEAWAALLAAEEGRRPTSLEQALARRSAKVLFVVGVVAAVLVATAVFVTLLTRLGE